jgi:hypothetical protein
MRKKNYYTQMEDKLEQCESQIKRLKADLKYYKDKCYLYESTQNVQSGEFVNEHQHFEEIRKFAKEHPEEQEEIVKRSKEYFELFGPYGSQRISFLDSSFKAIIENIIPESYKLGMKTVTKELPIGIEELKKYLKMTKFEKLEKYPNDGQRQMLDQMTSINFKAEEWENFYVNCRPLYNDTRVSLSNFVSELLSLRTSLFKTLISFDAYSKYFSPHHIKPEQVKDYLEANT